MCTAATMSTMNKVFVGMFAASVVIALSGCAGLSPSGSPSSPSESPAASRMPSPSVSTAAADGPVVIRISATVTADRGETAHLVETVRAPRAITASDRKRLTTALCRGWETDFPAAAVLPVEMRATEVTGTWPNYHDVELLAGYRSRAHTNTAAAWTGDWIVAHAYCSDGVTSVPGSASAVMLIDPKTPVDAESWGAGTYGFFDDFSEDKPNVKLSDCTIEIGSAASASPRLASLKSSDASHGCAFGWSE
jgi:hypothetical protein